MRGYSRTRTFSGGSGLTERTHQVGSLTVLRSIVVRDLARVLCHQEWQRKHTTWDQENDYPQYYSESQRHDCTFARYLLHAVCH